MRFTIDTDLKTITVEGQCNICDLHKKLKKMLPNDYKQYSVQSKIEYWNSPNIIQPYQTEVNPLNGIPWTITWES